MIVAILMGREGSSGFPGKNTHPVLGRPMVHYPLAAAAAAVSVERIYVTTDSPGIRAVADGFGARLIDRPAALCGGGALGEDVYRHAHGVIAAELAAEGRTPELYVLLMANAPTIDAATIDDGVATLRADPTLDSAVTVSRYNMWSPLRARQVGDDGVLRPFVPFEAFGDPRTLNCDRDSQGDVWFADMGVSIIRPANLDRLEDGLLPQKWMGRRIHPLKQWGGCDVDYPWQLPQVEYWLRAHGVEPADAPATGAP